MDKYEKKVRVNQIVACIKNGGYQEAQSIADSIDWRQEKSIRTLRMVSEVYKINRRYEDALAVLNMAYEKDPEDPIKRKIVYDLCELAIKMGEFGIAVRYMKEFSKLAPKDPGRYILQYRLLKATDADYSERIELLEEFKSRHFGDFDGKWAYELAYMYHCTGKSERCVECCNEIALWFVTGPVVVKALKLKKQHQELTYEEEQKIASADDGSMDEEVLYQKRHQTDTGPVYMDTTPVIGDGYSTADVEERMQSQQPVPDPMQQMYGQYPMQQEMPQQPAMTDMPQGMNIEVKKVDASMEPTIRMAEKKTGPSILSRETNVLPNINKSMPPVSGRPEGATPDPSAAPLTAAAGTNSDQSAPAGTGASGKRSRAPIKGSYQIPGVSAPADGDQGSDGSTAQIAVPAGSENKPAAPASPAIPGVQDALTQTGTIAQQEISVNLDKYSTMNLQAELRENMEKLQQETGEPLREKEEKLPGISAEPDKDLTELKAKEDTRPRPIPQPESREKPAEEPPVPAVKEQKEPEAEIDPETGQKVMTAEEIASKISSVPMPDQFGNFMSQEPDGQMQLNVPDDPYVEEKQITGQMDIESILAEWDRVQEEARERRMRAAKKKSLEQTNELSKQLKAVMPDLTLPKSEEEKALEEQKAIERQKAEMSSMEAPSPESMAAPYEESAGAEVPAPEGPVSAQPEPVPGTSSFTGPLVVPGYETGGVSVSDIEAALTADTDNEIPVRSDQDYNDGYRDEPTEPAVQPEQEAPPQVGDQEPQKKNPHFVSYDTVELPSVFDSFKNIKGLPQQLKEAEGRMSMEASHGNVLIMGSEHAARMELVQAIVRDMSERDQKKGEVKAAAIDSDTFNNKDVVKSLKALEGNILVIEGAGRLSDDAMNTLLSTLAGEEQEILVILEDSKGGAKNLSEYDRFNEVFDVVLDIPTLSNDYLVDHARNYAKEKFYTLDDMAVLALYQRIDERQTADHVVTSDEVEHIIDAAIKKANKKNLKHLGDVLFGKRYNDDDLIVLREKDFAK